MSDSKWTPEPWTIGVDWENDGWPAYRLRDMLTDSHEEASANGVRIAACVNACAGIEDPQELRRQRDELLETLENLHFAVIDVYKSGRIPAEPFVQAGNIIAKTRSENTTA